MNTDRLERACAIPAISIMTTASAATILAMLRAI